MVRAPLDGALAIDVEPAKSHRKRNTILVAAGVVAMVALVGLFLSMGKITAQAMPGGDTQEREHAKATFRNLDAGTDVHQLSIDNVSRVRAAGSMLEAIGAFKMFRVRGGNREWVFIYQRDGVKNALQGIPMEDDQVPNVLHLDHQLASYLNQHTVGPVQEVVRSSTIPQWSNWSNVVSPRPRHVEFDQLVKSYVDTLRDTSWRHTITFVINPKMGQLYVATVPHPVDDASRARASAFVDDAITRPRTIHHAPAICALMLALNPPQPPPAWLDWLEKTTSTPEDKLMLESDPPQDEPAHGVLRIGARHAQAYTAHTLAVLSDYQKVDASLSWLNAEPDLQSRILIRMAAGRQFVGAAGHRRGEVLAKLPAKARPIFEVAQDMGDKFDDPIEGRLKLLETWEPSAAKYRATLIELGNAFMAAQRSSLQRPDMETLRRRTVFVVTRYIGKDVTKVPEPMLWMNLLGWIDAKECRHLLLHFVRQRNAANAAQSSWVTPVIDRVRSLGLGDPSEASREFEIVQQLTFDRTNPIRREDYERLVSALDMWSRQYAAVAQRYAQAKQEHLAGRSGTAIPTGRQPLPSAPASPAALKSTFQRLLAFRSPSALAQLKKMLDDGFDFKTLDSPGDDRIPGESALHLAVSARNLQAVQLLVEKGADIHLSLRHRRTPLNEAVFAGDTAVAEFLLSKGAKCSTEPAPVHAARSRTKDMPTLNLAARSGHVPMMELLLRHGADVNACPQPGQLPPRTPLDEALELRHHAACALLLTREGKVVASHEYANWHLKGLLSQPDISLVPLLFKSGMKLTTKRPSDDLLLVLRSRQDGVELADTLLGAGAPIYLQTYDALTKEPRQASLVAVIRRHSHARAKETGRNPVALYDAMKSSPVALRKFIDDMTDISAPIDDGDTTLLALAVATAQPAAIKLLISKGADPNKTPGLSAGESLLASAINSRNIEVVKVLIDGGADIGSTPPRSMTSPLLKAIQSRQRDMIKLLIDRGADPDAPATHVQVIGRRSAFEMALLSRDTDIIDQLAQTKALPGKEAAKIRRQFLAAVAGGRTSEMDRLVKAGFDVGEVDQQPSLVTAAISSHVPVKSIEHLLKLGAPVVVDDLLHCRVQRRTDLETMIIEAGTKAKDAQISIAFAWFEKVKQGSSAIEAGLTNGTDAKTYVDARGWTLLHMAVFAGNVDSVRYLRQIGVADRPDHLARWAAMFFVMHQNPQLQHQLMQALNTPPRR